MFAIKDHRTDEDIIEKSYPQIREAGASLSTAEARASFLQEYKIAKLKLIANLKIFSDYVVVNDDQVPTEETTLASWLIEHQSKLLTTDTGAFLDFRAPIEFEALLVSDELM